VLVGDKLRDARCVVALLDSVKDEKQLIVGEMSLVRWVGVPPCLRCLIQV